MQNHSETGKNSAKQKRTKTNIKSFFSRGTGLIKANRCLGHEEHSKNRAATGKLTNSFALMFIVDETGEIWLELRELQDQM